VAFNGFLDDSQPPVVAETSFDLGEATELEPAASSEPAAAPVSPAQLLATPPVLQEEVGDLPLELRRPLEVIESYVAAGFVDNAREILEDLPPRLASHPALLRRLAGLGLEPPPDEEELVSLEPPAAMPEDEPLQLSADFLGLGGSEPGGQPAPVTLGTMSLPGPEPEPDLSGELGELFGAQSAVNEEAVAISGTDFGDNALADIFREFQRGVEKQLGKEDYETRYNLGIAYKEMGLIDEAISEFQLAAKDESRLLECASMLGICFVGKGLPKLAVKWFEKGLAAPGRSEEEYQALRYDLACALEQAGDLERALSIFTDLYGQDAKFRDVAEKVRQLSGR
jgi:tetratricopeptide (TPR) repeat protein